MASPTPCRAGTGAGAAAARWLSVSAVGLVVLSHVAPRPQASDPSLDTTFLAARSVPSQVSALQAVSTAAASPVAMGASETTAGSASAGPTLSTACAAFGLAALAAVGQRRRRPNTVGLTACRATPAAAAAGDSSFKTAAEVAADTKAASAATPAAAGAPAAAGSAAKAGKEGSSSGRNAPEELIAQLEGKMHDAVVVEDYAAAAGARDELMDCLDLEDEGKVLLANAALYDAFSKKDIKQMEALWLQAPYVECIHPLEKRNSGHSAVIESWKRLFEAATARKSIISAEDVRVTVRGATAIVTCSERVKSKGMTLPTRSMMATNIFRKVGERWLLIHRHVSPIATNMRQADGAVSSMTGMFGGGLDGDSAEAALDLEGIARLLGGSMASARITIQQGNNMGFNNEDDGDDDDDVDDIAKQSGMSGTGKAGRKGKAYKKHAGEILEMANLDPADYDSDEDSDEGVYAESDEEDGMEVARETVRALRQLHAEGLITPQAKVRLLAEVVKSDGGSMPERAYELLLHSVEDSEREEAWADFAALIACEAKRLEEGTLRKKDPPDGGNKGPLKGFKGPKHGGPFQK